MVSDSAAVAYATAHDGAHLAYQVLSDGTPDIVSCGYGTLISIDMRDEEPHLRRFEHQLAQFGRLIRFDPRGIGLSDPLTPGAALTAPDLGRDLASVLDHAGIERAVLYAVGSSGAAAIATAADHSARVSALILINCYARLASAPDYPFGIPQHLIDAFMHIADVGDESAVPSDRSPAPSDDIRLLAPSLADDPAYRAWWTTAGRRGASPASARTLLPVMFGADTAICCPPSTVPPSSCTEERTGSSRSNMAGTWPTTSPTPS